jgi:phage-related protein
MSSPPTWTVLFYQDAHGTLPVDTWIKGLNPKDTARVLRSIGLLVTHGARLGMPHSRHLRRKLWELRISSGRKDFRILYFAAPGREFLLLHAFTKKTDKTPEREMEIAERRLYDYLTRNPERS